MKVIKLKPELKETIWGGQKLKDLYKPDNMENVAEAWVLSCHRDGQSVVAEGEYKGQPLGDVIAQAGNEVLGTNVKNHDEFPILIKLIDARDKLSVQVHPDNAYARENENDSGKTEAWYMLDCTRDAELIYGFKEILTKEDLRRRIENGTLLDAVNTVKVKNGDVAFIPAGTLHAIGAGILLAEVQQSSNTTYRVFDYNRTDKDGKQRELHVDRAVDVLDAQPVRADFSALSGKRDMGTYAETPLAQCGYFKMLLLETVTGCRRTADERSFVSLVVLDGEGVLGSGGENMRLKKGDSVFIPAGSGAFDLKGRMNILETRI